MIRNLIFDLDGTLIDSSDGVVAAVNYSLCMMDQPEQPPDRIKPYIGYPLSQMYPDFTEAPLDSLFEHFRVKAAETVVSSTELLPGVADVLSVLRSGGYRMAIATTKIRVHLEGIAGKFGWQADFQALVGGDEVDEVKPAPDAFRLALKRLGADPAETLVIGDTINDVLGAQRVPLLVAAVRSPYGTSDDLKAAQPDFFMESLGELPALLDSLNTVE